MCGIGDSFEQPPVYFFFFFFFLVLQPHAPVLTQLGATAFVEPAVFEEFDHFVDGLGVVFARRGTCKRTQQTPQT